MKVILMIFLCLTFQTNAQKFECPKGATTSSYTVSVANPENCSTYYECKKGEATLKSCPIGKEFNADRNNCDMADEANCWDSIKEARKKEKEEEKNKKKSDLEETVAMNNATSSEQTMLKDEATSTNETISTQDATSTEEAKAAEKTDEVKDEEKKVKDTLKEENLENTTRAATGAELDKNSSSSENSSKKTLQDTDGVKTTNPSTSAPKSQSTAADSSSTLTQSLKYREKHGTSSSLFGQLLNGLGSTWDSTTKALFNIFSILG
ncbi:uncharacterized protein LOC129796224 [Lutzomyia longipalpis]|uniref:uncharacterized protein LOC129796224 n=1 Tax=Lutzomyia longipalpis TaxID=7200 RepID=UPI0024837A9C|nr:uncharacterized protein LOC129796224 [Lutzomyia longipalpis]